MKTKSEKINFKNICVLIRNQSTLNTLMIKEEVN
jgi:hypothetical protein